ncbi:MAG: NCS2 family permease [Planctomycetota bacterium]|nr:NCS2 family permease [Planctomycetota bacterium]
MAADPAHPRTGLYAWLYRAFPLEEEGTTIRREVLGGLTTFMTMAYIIVVNPAILGATGMDFKGVMVATCLASAFATLMMGLFARYPIAMAPGMGLNFFFAYEVCIGRGIPWQAGLGLVFLAGVLFLVLALFRVREMIVDAIPSSVKIGAAVGIGLFITFIGMQNAGLVIRQEGSLVQLGNLGDAGTGAALIGLVVTAALIARGVRGGVLIGIVVTAAAAALFGKADLGGDWIEAPAIGEVAFRLDIVGALRWEYLDLILIFLFLDLFDTIGTLIGVGEQAGLVKDGKLPRMNRALLSDAAGSVVAGTLGTSTVTSYIESASGVAAGARTGLASVITALCFASAIFFAPLAQKLGDTSAITAPALIIVGCLMTGAIRRVSWDDFTEAFPAFVTMVVMPFTYSIAHGLSLGFISYPLIKLLAGRGREVHAVVYLLAVILTLRYVFL